ncbi:STAS/SEC14 domain-containing protein [Uliginosibacterium sp. sgz301328]|uniref:STAS/SEC14 domain-containing protein n=1 Tax=Uliginosibacterium sp. sgz301328 TaxID=3243764 RepID=UPI00359EA62B
MMTTEVFPSRVEVRAFGEITLADYKVFEEQANYRIRFNGEIDLLLDFRDVTGVTIDALLEEFRFSRAHKTDFARVAVLTNDNLMTWGAFLSQVYSKADIRVFQDEESARAWLGDQPTEAPEAGTQPAG